MLPGPKEISEPHKELRFTRSAQASHFSLLAAICGGASATILILSLLLDEFLLSSWWSLAPLPAAFIFFRLSLHCIRHAYLILTPLGIEVFPFFKPRKNLQVLYWSQISDAEVVRNKQLVIHLNREKTSGIVASLTPLHPVYRELLEHAIAGRMAEKTIHKEPDESLSLKDDN